MKLLNVRLGPDDARRVAELRRAGVELSRVVREALRAEHERRVQRPAGRRRPSEIMAEIYAGLPDLLELPPRRYDVHDRHAARRAILRRLRRKRR